MDLPHDSEDRHAPHPVHRPRLGATGKTGRRVVDHLRASGTATVRGLPAREHLRQGGGVLGPALAGAEAGDAEAPTRAPPVRGFVRQGSDSAYAASWRSPSAVRTRRGS
ncbi:hypothetical protein SMICM304S_00565 [Streptomyces microflavus]